MKRLLPFALLLLIALPVFADETAEPQAELAISGHFALKADYALDLQAAFPLDHKGRLLLGPKLHLDDYDPSNGIGGVFEWNFVGSSRTGPFIGADALYLYNHDGGGDSDNYVVNAVAGLKFQFGDHEAAAPEHPHAFLKLYASKIVAGCEPPDDHITANVGIGVRF